MICVQCGKEFEGSGELCNTCHVRNFLKSVGTPEVKSSVEVRKQPEVSVPKKQVTHIGKSYEGLPNGMVVRICLDCKSVYLANGGNNLLNVSLCRHCGKTTGFFETLHNFVGYLQGNRKVSKANVRDVRLMSMLNTIPEAVNLLVD